MDNKYTTPSRYYMRECTCSECGKKFIVSSPAYVYKIHDGGYWSNKKTNSKKYQCSYTCYDHARLRAEKLGTIYKEKYKEYVIKSEESMKRQGKTILFPIDLKRKLK